MVSLFLGGIRPLPPGNEPTGIFKAPCERPVWLGAEGLIGDAQADRRVHGGIEKALHQYAVGSYAKLAAAFPASAAGFVPGGMGENLSVPGWDEANVCIGDIFRLGDARIQVSQPRSPCWKLDRRHGADGLMQHILDSGLTGWYFRVIEEGEVAPGCEFALLERPAPQAQLARVWSLWRAPQPDVAALAEIAALPFVSPNWARKLAARCAPPS